MTGFCAEASTSSDTSCSALPIGLAEQRESGWDKQSLFRSESWQGGQVEEEEEEWLPVCALLPQCRACWPPGRKKMAFSDRNAI